ncbi:MAG TPA: HNH endonuclease domain-containing protein [Bacteroidales bacterium]|nr:HNH endonuclease domain-containing protein [Bacteroidales bacterium]
MTKILGLDLGTNSIGWAVIDKEKKEIVNCGVRIFQEGVVKETIGQGDKEISKNAERREHRQARRLHYRKKLRKIQLLNALIRYAMCPLTTEELKEWKNWDKAKKAAGKKFPASPEFVEWLRLNPYLLRTKAINEPISRFELGRILYHFIQRRGFLSSRKGSDEGAIFKGKDNMEGIDDTRKMIKDETLGKKLFDYLPIEGTPYKRIIDEEGKEVRVRSRYTLREMYIAEFEKIWQRQANHLALDTITVPLKKVIILKGDLTGVRNAKRIENLKHRFGEQSVSITADRIEVRAEMPLKVFLAGDITSDEEGIRFSSNNSVLFWQRPLRSQKGLLGKCTFESKKFFDKKFQKWITIGSSPCPLSHPDFELFRAYQFINNIRYGRSGLVLNDSFRQQVLDLINSEDKNFDFEKIPKKLKMTYEQFNYDNKLKVAGNTTHKKLLALFDETLWNTNKEVIWHYFHFYSDPELLSKKLVERFGFDEEKAKKASAIKLKDGYGSVSLKAIRNILPFLKMGYQYPTAVVLGGVKNAFGSRWEYFKESHNEIIKKIVNIINNEKHKEYGLIAKIKELLADPVEGYGFSQEDRAFQKLYHHSQEIERKEVRKRLSEIPNLRNPIVQKGLFEMRRLVNTLLDTMDQNLKHGPAFRFDRIHVELSRELRNSKTQRQEMSFKIRDNEAANDEARIRLQEYGLKPSRENITKYKLFREIEEKHGSVVCPYTNRPISITDLLGQLNLFQIEHIIPYSISLDDSFANKTLCESNFNRDKGEKTPFEYYQKNSSASTWGANSWDEIEQRTFRILPYQKARKFIARKSFQTEGFIERQLNDGRYIAKKSAELLTEICDDVRVMPGQLTSELRRLWGLNNIIQPVMPLNLKGIKISDEDSIPHYIILDKDSSPIDAIPIPNERPTTQPNQILIPGIVDTKGVFTSDKEYRSLKFSLKVDGMREGRHWIRINVSKPIGFTKVFVEKPVSASNEIVYKGRVEKGYFSHDSINKKIKTTEADGLYWVKFNVEKTSFIEPDKDRPPTTKSNQVLLYGNVNENNQFVSYIYQCESNVNPGRYWALLEIDFDSADFTRAIVQPPMEDNKLIVHGSIGGDSVFSADCDPTYQQQTTLTPGKYFTILEVEAIGELFPIENKQPLLQKGESLIEGSVWVNRQTGEIMFDPKKNRDDHRHHAVDAITIAFMELGYLQKLSHYYGAMKARGRGMGDRPIFSPPWEGFDRDAKTAVEGILVSYSPSSKVLSKISKVVSKNGQKFQSVGYAARGRLHREFYFGRHPRLISNRSVGADFEKDNQGDVVNYYHIRKSITAIDTNKHIEKIVDQGIKKLIIARLQEQGIDVTNAYKIPPNFFFDKEGNPLLYLPNKRGEPVPVKKVRLRETIGNAVQLKDNLNQWVNPYNNHHMIIYIDTQGELKESIVSFWEVIERIQQNQEVYQLPCDGKEILTTMQVNDMFLLNLPRDFAENIELQTIRNSMISHHLYRVQKLSSMYYTFRHHLASTITNAEEEIRIQSMPAWINANPIKVKMDCLGNYELIK